MPVVRPRTTIVLFTRDLRVHDHPALAEAVPGARVHEPWRLDAAQRRRLGYPEPIVDHGEAAAAFHRRRRRAS